MKSLGQQTGLGSTYRTKKSFSLMPEIQAAIPSVIKLPPIQTCWGFRSLRNELGDQGRRKTAIPAAHWVDKLIKRQTLTRRAEKESSCHCPIKSIHLHTFWGVLFQVRHTQKIIDNYFNNHLKLQSCK